MLELLEGKLSRAVLRGLGGSNPVRLPGADWGTIGSTRKSADMWVGYSITQAAGDFVSSHYGIRNVINCIIPITMPTADGSTSSYLWAWPNLIGFTPTFKERVRSRPC
jgi:hypothetical protein